MIIGQLIHPQILDALGRAGHGSKVLIADGNYPVATTVGPRSRVVHLNLAPGVLDVTQVTTALLTVTPVEAAAVMQDDRGEAATEPGVWRQFRDVLASSGATRLEALQRQDFYAAAGDRSVALTIATGDQRLYANLLLTIGVVGP